LQFENNIPQAIVLLQNADGYLSGLSDDRLRPVRKALAADVAALQAVPQIDVVGIYMRLVALNDQIKQLPLPNKPQQTDVVQAPSNENLPWWKRGLRQTEQALKQIVVIRYNAQDTLPFITPEQQNFLILNLHAEMENAIWGLLHQQPEIYRTSLTQAKNWIIQYGQSDSPMTKSLITNLTQLEQMNIKPEPPKSLQSLQEFPEYFAALAPQPPMSH
jgi:uroporphyrin-III C-methyltransferase